MIVDEFLEKLEAYSAFLEKDPDAEKYEKVIIKEALKVYKKNRRK